MDGSLVILGVFIVLLIVTIFVGRHNARKESSRPNRYRSTHYRSDPGFDSTECQEPLNIRVAGIIVAITAATLVEDTTEEIPVAGIMEETLVEEALVGDTTKV